MSVSKIFADVLLAHSEHDLTPISKSPRLPTADTMKAIRFQMKKVRMDAMSDAQLREVLVRVAALSFAGVEGIDSRLGAQ